MDFAITLNDENWQISTLNGIVLGHAESVSMVNVRFSGVTAVGRIEAIWGATLLEAAYNTPSTSRNLGINKLFSGVAGRQAKVIKGEWVDHSTGRPLRTSEFLSLYPTLAVYTEKKNRYGQGNTRGHALRNRESELHAAVRAAALSGPVRQ